MVGWFLTDITTNTNAIDRSLGSIKTWMDITTAAGSGVVMEAIGADFGLRKDGSAESIIGHPGGTSHCWMFVESVSQIVEGYATTTGADLFEVGTFDAATVGGLSIPVAMRHQYNYPNMNSLLAR